MMNRQRNHDFFSMIGYSILNILFVNYIDYVLVIIFIIFQRFYNCLPQLNHRLAVLVVSFAFNGLNS